MTGHGQAAVLADGAVTRAYRAVSCTARYQHYAVIPGRICRSFDYLQARYDRVAVQEKLAAYYLFIGVVDHALDSEDLRLGEEILDRLRTPVPSFDERTLSLPFGLVTEVLKTHIVPETYPEVLSGLERLYRSVVQERRSGRLKEYIKDRRVVGELTSEVSFHLIKPHLENRQALLYSFLTEVGALGCLCDSILDMRADRRQGLLNFYPSLRDHLRLTGHFLQQGLRILVRYPALLPLFLAGIADTFQDNYRLDAPACSSTPLP